MVANQDRAYVVARSGDGSDTDRAHLYPLPAGGDVDAMLNDLGLESTVEATDVPEDWLRLFPAGGELGWTSFGITDARSKPDDPAPYPPSARVGDYWVDGDEGLVLTRTGPMRLTPFAFQVFLNTPVPVSNPAKPGKLPRPIDGELPRVAETGSTYDDASWPAQVLEPLTDLPVRAAPDEPRQAARGGAHAEPGRRHQRRERRPIPRGSSTRSRTAGARSCSPATGTTRAA